MKKSLLHGGHETIAQDPASKIGSESFSRRFPIRLYIKKAALPLYSLLLLSATVLVMTSCEEEVVEPAQQVELRAAGDCGTCGSYPICCAGNADPDGDGWGWQWNQTCIVNNSGPANDNCGGGSGGGSGSCNGYSYCSSSSSDPDGDGWGWENSSSCIVSGSGADTCNGGGGGGGGSSSCNGYSYCSSSSSDPDGDGWGWENNSSCIVSGSGADTCNGGGGGGGGGGSSGSCPSSLSCPGSMSCGCYTVNGLGSNKQAYQNAGAGRSFLASAMMETETITTNYTYGDGKTGDAFNAGACKQNWGMMRQCHAAWNGLGSGSYNTSAAMNSNKSLDVQVYNECRNYYGSNWWAGHRNGSSGLANPNTQDIQNFIAGYNWTYNNIAGHLSDNVRFWVSIPAI